MAWTEQLRAVRETKKAVAEHPWRAILSDVTGELGRDGLERIATDRLFDLMDVLLPGGMPRFKRTPEAQKQLKGQMVLLGWCPVRARLVTRGFAARVRAYARLPRRTPPTISHDAGRATCGKPETMTYGKAPIGNCILGRGPLSRPAPSS
jgi:hypothetical protein